MTVPGDVLLYLIGPILCFVRQFLGPRVLRPILLCPTIGGNTSFWPVISLTVHGSGCFRLT